MFISLILLSFFSLSISQQQKYCVVDSVRYACPTYTSEARWGLEYRLYNPIRFLVVGNPIQSTSVTSALGQSLPALTAYFNGSNSGGIILDQTRPAGAQIQSSGNNIAIVPATSLPWCYGSG